MKLTENDIRFYDAPCDKMVALAKIAGFLTESGNTTHAYAAGMVQREEQISTYLGNGIAIPHGTPEVREHILCTGVKVIAFRHGVEWEPGLRAYVVIGIAARSDEHLTILRKLTHVLADDSIPERIAAASTPAELLSILMRVEPESRITLHEVVGQEIVITLNNPHGLHTRPSAILVREAKKFPCELWLSNINAGTEAVNAKNLMKVVSLGIKSGQKIKLVAVGEQADDALRHLHQAFLDGLGESEVHASPPPVSWFRRLLG